MKKILIIAPSWVGDMVMSQSLYKILKKQHSDCIIDVLAPNWCKAILERMPEINQAIEMPIGHGDFNFFGRKKLGESLIAQKYDQAIILPRSAKSALIPWFAKIPVRTGWKGEMRYGLLNDLRSNMKSFQYMVERYAAHAYSKTQIKNPSFLGGLENIARPQLTIDHNAKQKALSKFNLLNHQKVIGLCPGAEFGPAKKWPEAHYAAVAQEMASLGHEIYLFGSAKDIATCEQIKMLVAKDLRSHLHILAGKTTLTEAIDLLSTCNIVVANDSGLMHIAAAVECQVIAIYGSTSTDYTPPLTDKVITVASDIDCRPCFKRECPYKHLNCLTKLSSQLVIDHIKIIDSIKMFEPS